MARQLRPLRSAKVERTVCNPDLLWSTCMLACKLMDLGRAIAVPAKAYRIAAEQTAEVRK